MYDEERKAIVDYGKRLITERLISGTSGNISIFDPRKKLMIISPSGIPYCREIGRASCRERV